MMTDRDSLHASDPSNREIKVFVYGTLKPGEDNYENFCKDKYITKQSAWVKGSLYDLPMGFPAMVESDEFVRGVLYHFKDENALLCIDQLEGYDPRYNQDRNLYERKIVDVYDNDKKPITRAWAYYMTLARALTLNGKKVENGNWSSDVRFLKSEHQNLINKIRYKE
jgi:gamma-glutamylcyclotransferase (GGCT)/AIG2-like uncharacterized protein YtfP